MDPAEESYEGKRILEAPPPYAYALQAGAQEFEGRTVSKGPYNDPYDATRAQENVGLPFNFPSVSAAMFAHSNGSASGMETVLPTSESWHNNRSYCDLPEVATSPASGSSSRTPPSPPILAIPQITPEPSSPFLPAYSTAYLLRRGILDEAFISFLSTLSALLSATVSERALAHVADVGRSLNDIPKKFSKDTVAHVRDVGRNVEESAKKGKLISAGINALAGTVSIPIAAAFRIVNATVHQLPIAVGDGLAKKPLSPRERAEAYVAATQKDWFQARGLRASLCDTRELLMRARSRGLGAGNRRCSGSVHETTVERLVDLVHNMWESGAEGQLQALQHEFGFMPLEITDGHPGKHDPLRIEAGTLWLVLTDAPSGA